MNKKQVFVPAADCDSEGKVFVVGTNFCKFVRWKRSVGYLTHKTQDAISYKNLKCQLLSSVSQAL